MIGWHLIATPWRRIDRRSRILTVSVNHEATRDRKLIVARAILKLLQRPIAEGIDVSRVVREEQLPLTVLDIRAGVMQETF